mmetsp:Transcript_30288/g.50133  ORF Transcript_30288/g.50133 Transcript_30288/m.50133 type:complete len:143 (+) Transcript_30288:151-579(+)
MNANFGDGHDLSLFPPASRNCHSHLHLLTCSICRAFILALAIAFARLSHSLAPTCPHPLSPTRLAPTRSRLHSLSLHSLTRSRAHSSALTLTLAVALAQLSRSLDLSRLLYSCARSLRTALAYSSALAQSRPAMMEGLVAGS